MGSQKAKWGRGAMGVFDLIEFWEIFIVNSMWNGTPLKKSHIN